MTVELTPSGLDAGEVVAVARDDDILGIGAETRLVIDASASVIDDILASGKSVYGVTTGFGALANTSIPPERSAELQLSLIRSHAAGMGPLVEREVVRAMMTLRARSLAMGYSGVRIEVVEALVSLINAGLTPAVPEHGSLGASGDLAPLAHCALTLVGEGEFTVDEGGVVPAAEGLALAGLAPVVLRAKEGLALINGTDGMLGMLVLALDDLGHLMSVADITAATSVEGLLGTDRAFADDLQQLRPQIGQASSAANLRSVLAGSEIVASHLEGDDLVQDAYSLRCTPAVHGSLRDTVAHAVLVADRELASAIDNPMILPDGRVESCGNFHGAPLAQVADFLAIAIADAGALSERRTDRMLDVARSRGLEPFLAHGPGVDSGLMIAHYTQAAMVAENRRLAAPASTDTVPTSAMQEDHVSMGWGALRKLRQSVANLARILTVEFVTAARAVEARRPLRPAVGTGAAIDSLRSHVTGTGPDRWLAPELATAHDVVFDREFVAAVERASGPLTK